MELCWIYENTIARFQWGSKEDEYENSNNKNNNNNDKGMKKISRQTMQAIGWVFILSIYL